ncbi:hypothetical protein C8Q77DRAFT_316031 [Trametes polyzona]|nr:hypothetical protein C8Q77DRAFT_316031 [Trametes polyzona]
MRTPMPTPPESLSTDWRQSCPGIPVSEQNTGSTAMYCQELLSAPSPNPPFYRNNTECHANISEAATDPYPVYPHGGNHLQHSDIVSGAMAGCCDYAKRDNGDWVESWQGPQEQPGITLLPAVIADISVFPPPPGQSVLDGFQDVWSTGVKLSAEVVDKRFQVGVDGGPSRPAVNVVQGYGEERCWQGSSRTVGLEILPQNDYGVSPHAQRFDSPPIVVEYGGVLLSDAIEGRGVGDPNQPAFPIDAKVGVKLSVCSGLTGVKPLGGLKFAKVQYRVRTGKNPSPPVSRRKLAHIVATYVQKLLEGRTLVHGGETVRFEAIHLIEVRQKSRGTIQPVFGIRRGVGRRN